MTGLRRPARPLAGAARPLPPPGRGHAASRARGRGRLLAVSLALASGAAGGAAGSEAAPAEGSPAVRVHDHGRASTVEAELPGTLLDLAPACGGVGRCRGLWLLVRPAVEIAQSDSGGAEPPAARSAAGEPGGDPAAGPPPRLLLLDAARAALGDPAATLTESPIPLPRETESLALADLDGDGAPELLAGAPGRVWSLGDPASPGRPVPVLTDPDVDLAAARPLLDPALPLLPSPAVGRLRWYRPAAGGGLTPAGSAPLPVRTRRRAHGLELSSPQPTLLPAAGGAPPRWAAGPEPHGDRRLRSLLVDPLSGDGAAAEYWSMLPSPERVESARFLTLDGHPALAVFTHAADRLGIFDQARLRLFRLGADRTRAGSVPILAVDTTSHRWQRAAVAIADLDADGRDDVSIAQVKGLGGGAILIETYRGMGGGRFDRRPKKVRLDAPDATWRWLTHADSDLDGDDLPDLIALSEGRLLIYTSAPRRPGTALGDTPTWEIAWPRPEADETREQAEGVTDDGGDDEDEEDEEDEDSHRADHRFPGLGGFPGALDLDGDHRPEIVFRAPLPDGRERLRIVLLR